MNIRRTLFALGGALALSLGFALTPAQAQVGNHNCSEGSIDEPTGDIIIFDTTGGCTLGSLNAGGQITITSNGPVSIAGPVTATGDINVSATGALQTGAGQLSSSSGSILLFADTTITVNGISNSAGGLALYSGNGGNIHVVGAITGGTGSSVSIVSDIGGAGTVTVDSSITAGLVEIRSNGNIQVTGALNSQTVGGHVDIKTTASGGTIKLDGAVTAPGQVVELVAFGNISTKTIDTSSTNTGIYQNDVRIIANKAATGAIPVFVIGGTGNSNGVNGSIIANTATSDNQYPHATRHNVAIVNGGSTATGGITIVNGTNISVASTTSRAGCILIDARNGPFTLQAGTLSTNGASGQSAGCIAIAADTMTIGSNGTMSANDDGTKGFNHYVSIAARQVGVTGTVNLQADGKGVSTSFPGSVQLGAKGSLTITIPEDYFTAIPGPTRTEVATQLTVNGSGSLVLRANGAINRVSVVAKPIAFSNTGTLTITANGASPNLVRINNPGSNTNVTGLSFTGGNVTVRSDGVSGVGDASGGYVEIFGDQMTLNANTHTFSANGPSAGNGNGGRFYFASSAATLKNTGKVTVTANAASAGSGNAILGDITTGDPKAIQFFPGSVNVDVGTASGVGQYTFSAKGGSTGGNGGTIYMSASSMTLKTANAINAAAIASAGNNGDGGEIYLNNYITVDPAATVTAIGKGTGKGGKFTAFHNISDIDILKYVKVDGGTTVPTNQLNGSIKLNGIWCRQWRLSGSQSWPKTHWVCTDQSDNPSVPAALSVDIAAADAATSASFSGLRTLFSDSTHKVQVFVFSGASTYNDFFRETLAAVNGGLTFKTSNSTNIYSSILQAGSIGHPTAVVNYSYAQMKEVAAHEFGHAADIAFRGTNANLPSNDTNWGSNRTRDIIDLNTVLDPVTFNQFHRFPCKKTPLDGGRLSLKAPLEGVTDVRTGVAACLANGDVNDAMLAQGNTWNQATVTATEVLNLIEQALFQSPPELHAQTLAWSAVGNQTARPMFDKVMDNGFFPCIKAWATTEKTGSLPTTGVCSAPLTQ